MAGPSRLRQWSIAAAVIAALGGWFIYTSIVPHPRHANIRRPEPKRHVPLDRFHWNGARNVRSIATITTCFTRDTWLSCDLFAIQNGSRTVVARQVAGRSSKLSRPDDPHLKTFPVTFALADAELEEGHTTLIAARGMSRGYGSLGGIHEPFDAVVSRTLTGRIDPGEERLLYVEGDRAFTANPGMTSEQFAAANGEGRFLVAILRLDR